MAKQVLRINNFSGGLSDDDKYGPSSSFAEGPGIDFRLSPGLLTLKKELFPESFEGANDGVIVSEVVDAVRVASGDLWLAGSSRMYKRAVSSNAGVGAYSVIAAGGGPCSDLLYDQSLDLILVMSGNNISEISPISQTPTYQNGKYGPYNALDQAGTGGTYAVPTAVSEAAADTLPFTCKNEPLYGSVININTKGTGSLQLIIHDSANNVIATQTRTNASIPTSGDMPSNFWDSPNIFGRLKYGNAYHVHVVNIGGSGFKLTTTAANDLTTADVTLKAQRLVYMDSNPFLATPYGHRAIQSGSKNYICNERYLAEWELLNVAAGNTDGYLPHRLAFPANYITCGLANHTDDTLAIACAVLDGSDSLDKGGASGRVFLWDKTSTFYNDSFWVPHGVPNSLTSWAGSLYWECRGRWYRWNGSDIDLVFEFPGVDKWQAADNAPQSEVYLRAARNAMTSWQGLLMIGFPYLTANLNVEYGVYSYGRNKVSGQDAIGYDYLSTIIEDGQVKFSTSGTPKTPVSAITMVKAFGSNLFVASKSLVSGSTTYAVDFTNEAQGYKESGQWASLWFDNDTPDKEKTALSVIITMAPLPQNSSVTPRVRFDRSETWINASNPQIATDGNVIVRMTIPAEQARFYEAKFGFTCTNDSTTGDAPEIVSVNFEFDDNEEEGNSATTVTTA